MTQEMLRISPMLDADSDECVVWLIKDYSIDEGLKSYGLYWQFMLGDAKDYYDEHPDEKPGRFNLQGKMMYDAWLGYEGWGYDESITEFVDLCKQVLERNGFSWEDPQK